MDAKVSDYLKSMHIGVLTVEQEDGLHGAALHFSHVDEPFELYFSTDRSSRKCRSLLDGKEMRAAVVVGTSEQVWKTVQLDGIVNIVSDLEKLSSIQNVHYKKHPGSAKYKDDPETVFLKFVPKWWRYTDFNTNPEEKIASDSK